MPATAEPSKRTKVLFVVLYGGGGIVAIVAGVLSAGMDLPSYPYNPPDTPGGRAVLVDLPEGRRAIELAEPTSTVPSSVLLRPTTTSVRPYVPEVPAGTTSTTSLVGDLGDPVGELCRELAELTGVELPTAVCDGPLRDFPGELPPLTLSG